jgi:hypothetical protein
MLLIPFNYANRTLGTTPVVGMREVTTTKSTEHPKAIVFTIIAVIG